MSSSNIVNIQPTTITGVSFDLRVQNITLYKSAVICCVVYDSSSNMIKANNFELSGDDYTNWGGDDTYLINYAANLYGYTIIPTTTTP
jgi:hypothetical protein